MGVIADQMLDEVNEWGYNLRKRPFIFTERTLSLRKNEDKIHEMEIFYLGKGGFMQPIEDLPFRTSRSSLPTTSPTSRRSSSVSAI